MWDKMKPMGFVLRWRYDPQDQGKWKWYKMVELEVNGAYKQSRYEKIGCGSSHQHVSILQYIPFKSIKNFVR